MAEAMPTLDFEKLKQKDEGELRMLFEQLLPKVLLMARRAGAKYRLESADCEDIANDAILHVYKRLDTILPQVADTDQVLDSLMRFANRVTFNLVTEAARSRQRRSTTDLGEVRVSPEYVDSKAVNAEEELVAAEEDLLTKELLDRVVQTLSAEDRQLFTLYLEGHPIKEIADILKLSAAEASRRHYNVIRRIRNAVVHGSLTK